MRKKGSNNYENEIHDSILKDESAFSSDHEAVRLKVFLGEGVK